MDMLAIAVRVSSARTTTKENARAEDQYIARQTDGQARPVLPVGCNGFAPSRRLGSEMLSYQLGEA
jgi:hypothetical protein